MKKIKKITALIMVAALILVSFGVLMTVSASSKLAIPSNARYFGGHAYKFYKTDCTWKEAKRRCENKGGHLATITSKKEDEFVYSLARCNAWLGATDEKNEGKWKWVTGEKFKYSNWDYTQPDNTAGYSDENYLGYHEGFAWNDFTNKPRAYVPHGYICEWEIEKISGIEQIYTSSTKVIISWNDQDLASVYEIYYESSKDKYIKYISTINSSMTISGLDSATEYNMKIRSKYKNSDGKTDYTPFVKFSIATKPGTVKKLKLVDTVSLNWSKVRGADRYAVYKYNRGFKNWEFIGSSSKNSYKLGKKFGSSTEYYKVKAYIKTTTGQKIFGEYSNKIKR